MNFRWLGVRRNELSEADSLTPRIIEAAKLVTVEDCCGWIRHAESFFPRYLAKEPKLYKFLPKKPGQKNARSFLFFFVLCIT